MPTHGVARFTFADHGANDRQPRERTIDRVVAEKYAAQAMRVAVAKNREGDYEGARRVLVGTAKKIGSYADGDEVPSSGFHHARPQAGSSFCTFSGQVIAAVKAWRDHGARGAWFDLDGHHGNSIEDAREFAPELADAIPEGCNVNPSGRGRDYLERLAEGPEALGKRVVVGDIHYVAFAHGADSHIDDDFGYQCDTYEWLAASCLVYEAIRAWSQALGRSVPVVLTLFGGYRDDSLESELERAREVGFGAGPNSVAGEVVRFDPPVSISEGLVFLEKHCEHMNAGHLALDDRTVVWFSHGGDCRRYDAEPQAPPSRARA